MGAHGACQQGLHPRRLPLAGQARDPAAIVKKNLPQELRVMKDLVAVAEKIAAKLIARRQTIAVAESSTGGLISASLLAVPGASAYFLGGAVVYTRDARRILMDIPDEAMKGIRSASEPYAKLLASQMRTRFATDWGLSETGATGPSCYHDTAAA